MQKYIRCCSWNQSAPKVLPEFKTSAHWARQSCSQCTAWHRRGPSCCHLWWLKTQATWKTLKDDRRKKSSKNNKHGESFRGPWATPKISFYHTWPFGRFRHHALPCHLADRKSVAPTRSPAGSRKLGKEVENDIFNQGNRQSFDILSTNSTNFFDSLSISGSLPPLGLCAGLCTSIPSHLSRSSNPPAKRSRPKRPKRFEKRNAIQNIQSDSAAKVFLLRFWGVKINGTRQDSDLGAVHLMTRVLQQKHPPKVTPEKQNE